MLRNGVSSTFVWLMLHKIAIMYHPRRKAAVSEGEWLASELYARGVQASLGSAWDVDFTRREIPGKDLVVALGGDGTIIHLARLAAPTGVALLGINLGRVGFLAELTPEALHGRVDELVEEHFWIELRSMLQVEWRDEETVDRFLCLNEVAVARGLSPRAVHVKTLLDGADFMTFTADAVLVATATGSTAYSLAAGGPVLFPEDTDIMITPVAPHLHIGRSVILPRDTEVSLILGSDRPAIVSVDGSDERELRPHHRVDVCRSDVTARFARFGPRMYFYSALAERLK
jgi:NAD+ kinase